MTKPRAKTSPGPAALPAGARAQLEALVAGLVCALPRNLVGVYLHGSLALGCFNAERSDVDLLVVTDHALDPVERQALRPVLLAGSGAKTRPPTPPFPLELSVLARDAVRPWRYPTPYELHFSEIYRGHIDDVLPRTGEDHDLAAHIAVLHAAGIVLHGLPVAQVFPGVPYANFADSLLRDLEWCRRPGRELYSVLSASRIWATLAEGETHSKATGAAWALERAPAEFRPLVARALALYDASGDKALDPGEAGRYVDFVAGELAAIALRYAAT